MGGLFMKRELTQVIFLFGKSRYNNDMEQTKRSIGQVVRDLSTKELA
jgi:hypothetical protein